METLTRIAVVGGVGSVLFAIMIAVWYLVYRRQERTRRPYLTRLKQERVGFTREQFIDEFVQHGVHQSVAATVYDYLRRHCTVSDFPLDPNDPLERVSGIVIHEEIDDILREMGYDELDDSEWEVLDWHALNLPPPSEPDAPVASLVHLVDALRVIRHGVPNTTDDVR